MDGETAYFESKKAEWLQTHCNEWVWIHDATAEFFPSYEAAVEHAYSKGFSNKPIFVKQIIESEPPSSISGIYRWAV